MSSNAKVTEMTKQTGEESAMLFQLEGDYAQGLRSMPVTLEGPDYARGQRIQPFRAEAADYASGLRTLPAEREGSDYARGLRTTVVNAEQFQPTHRKGLTAAGAPAAGK